MGQGAESCGAYEVEYDALAEAPDGVWIQADGSAIAVDAMKTSHLINARRHVQRKAMAANFTDDQETWEAWVDIFDREITERSIQAARQAVAQAAAVGAAPVALASTVAVARAPIAPPRGAKVTMACHCGQHYQARTADVKRGWGLSCSKRCAAIRRDFGRPAAKKVKGGASAR